MSDEKQIQTPEETPTPLEPKDDGAMRLTMVRQTVEVAIENESGDVEDFILKEMTGAVRDTWMNKTQTKMKTNAEGRSVGVKDFTGLQASLIAACLFTKSGLPVPEAKIQSFPSSTQNALFKRAQKMNGLDEESEKAAKKD